MERSDAPRCVSDPFPNLRWSSTAVTPGPLSPQTLHLRRLEEEVGALERKMQALQKRRQQRKTGPPTPQKPSGPAVTAVTVGAAGSATPPPAPAAARSRRSRPGVEADASTGRQVILPAEGVLVPDRMLAALVDYTRAFERCAGAG